ncbi:hypothetical protein ALC62_09980, partial [Cyphomyrmex costatus]
LASMSSEDSDSESYSFPSRHDLFDVDNDLFCLERPLMSNDFADIPKEKSNWNVATYHLRREIGIHCPRENLWIKTLVALDCRGTYYEAEALNWARRKNPKMENEMENLLFRATRIDTLEAYLAWETNCDEYRDLLREVCRTSRRPISTGVINSAIAKITRLESVKNTLRSRFVHDGSGHAGTSRTDVVHDELSWMEIETAFNNRMLTGAVVNSNYIEPRHFLNDARDIVIPQIRSNLQKHACLKVNTMFNGEFVVDNKRSMKSIATKNHVLYGISDLKKWYDKYVMDVILTDLEEFQERESGWALSRILNLIVNVNKFYPMHCGCFVNLPRRIILKRATVNVQSFDNACFAWSIVAALYPAFNHVSRTSQYPHYLEVLRFEDITFPVTLKQITKFEHLNDISVNVFVERETVVKQRKKGSTVNVTMKRKKSTVADTMIVPLRVTKIKRNIHVNLLYVQDQQHDDNGVGHFVLIKNLSRLISSQLRGNASKKYICDRYVRINFFILNIGKEKLKVFFLTDIYITSKRGINCLVMMSIAQG